jgi:lipopolysaccharide transport system permease protein
MSSTPSGAVPTTHIRSTHGWAHLDLRELWSFRELALFLVWRDIKVRYKQTAIGVAWAVLQPLAMMLVFTLFFGRLAKMPSDGIPYPLFAYTGLLPWQLFARCIQDSSASLVANQQIITRIYFPRILVPIGTVITAGVDFLIGCGLLVGLMAFYGIVPTAGIAWIPAFIVLMMVTALGIGIWLSALNLEYRDVGYAVPFLVQFLLFLTPVVYPTSLVPERWQFVYAINPMVGVVEGFRWALLGSGTGPGGTLVVSATVALLAFTGGIYFFRWRERTFVDEVG